MFGEFIGGTDGSDFAVGDEDCAVFDDAQFAEFGGAARGVVAAQREEVRGVGEEGGVSH